MTMAQTPDALLVHKILEDLHKKQLLSEKQLTELPEKMTSGRMKAEDWQVMVELAVDAEKKRKIEQIATMLRGAIDAQSLVGLMLNVKKADLASVLKELPALNAPTISELSNAEWVAVNTILEERVARDVIPRLKAAQATGIVEYPLNKVVL